MFCYCTNNAAEKPIKIDDVLMTMLEGQMDIKIAIGKILLDNQRTNCLRREKRRNASK